MSGASVTKKKSFKQCHLIVDLKEEEKLEVTNVHKILFNKTTQFRVENLVWSSAIRQIRANSKQKRLVGGSSF